MARLNTKEISLLVMDLQSRASRKQDRIKEFNEPDKTFRGKSWHIYHHSQASTDFSDAFMQGLHNYINNKP